MLLELERATELLLCVLELDETVLLLELERAAIELLLSTLELDEVILLLELEDAIALLELITISMESKTALYVTAPITDIIVGLQLANV